MGAELAAAKVERERATTSDNAERLLNTMDPPKTKSKSFNCQSRTSVSASCIPMDTRLFANGRNKLPVAEMGM